jgi:hypothetical protein
MTARVVVIGKVRDVGERDATRTGARSLGSCERFRWRKESGKLNQRVFPCRGMGKRDEKGRCAMFDKRRWLWSKQWIECRRGSTHRVRELRPPRLNRFRRPAIYPLLLVSPVYRVSTFQSHQLEVNALSINFGMNFSCILSSYK